MAGREWEWKMRSSVLQMLSLRCLLNNVIGKFGYRGQEIRGREGYQRRNKFESPW